MINSIRRTAQSGEECLPFCLELPRIGLNFEFRSSSLVSGAPPYRLYSREHDGLFLCTSPKRVSAAHRTLVPFSAVLENEQRQLFLLVPNYGLCQSRCLGETAFSDELHVDCSPSGWRQHVTVTHFVYPVHASGLFLRTPSLASALYLVVLGLFTRQCAPPPPPPRTRVASIACACAGLSLQMLSLVL